MISPNNNIRCPSCGEDISIDAVLSKQIEANIKKQIETERKAEIADIELREKKR